MQERWEQHYLRKKKRKNRETDGERMISVPHPFFFVCPLCLQNPTGQEMGEMLNSKRDKKFVEILIRG